MVERRVKITNKLGLHLRAAYLLVKTASAFRSDIYLLKDSIAVDAKSIMGLLGLEASVGTELWVRVKGPDEQDALAIVAGLIEAKFNEED